MRILLSICALSLSISQGFAADAVKSRAVKAVPASAAPTVELPLLAGWYQGKLLYYISTDMSDQAMAQQTGTNYVPRLSALIRTPPMGQPGQPGQPSALDRVYKFTNADQGSVFGSAPEPLGARSTSDAYTPLWQVYMVTWRTGVTPHVLHSEEEILDAEEKRRIDLVPTQIIVNCPIVYSPNDGALSGVRVHGKLPVR